jgi:hypothetical protein
MNKIEQMLAENHGLHTSYAVKNKDGEFESVVSVKSAAEITEQIAIEFAEWIWKNCDEKYMSLHPWESMFEEFLKTKQ